MNRRTFRLPQAPRSSAGLLLWRVLLGVTLVLALASPPVHAAEVQQEAAEVQVDEVLPDGIQRSLAGPDVVITAGKTRTVYEYRQNGRLRIVKIVPTFGRPYYLVPADQTRGYGDLDQANMLLPQWVIVEF